MGRSKRSKNKYNMRKHDKRSEEYKTNAQLKKERKQLKKEAQMEEKFLVGIYDQYRSDGIDNNIMLPTLCKRIGSYTTEPLHSMYDLGADEIVATLNDGQTSIKIEVWEITKQALTKLERAYNYFSELEKDLQDYDKKEIVSPYGKIIVYSYNGHIVNKDLYEVINGDAIEHRVYKAAYNGKTEGLKNLV